MTNNNNGLMFEQPVLMLGSLNAHIDDRTLKQSDLISAQLFENNSVTPLHYFNEWGKSGLCSIDWIPEQPNILYMTTGSDLIKLDLVKKTKEELPIDKIKDIHEIKFINRTLWLSNAGYDEAIAYDIDKKVIIERILLSQFRTNSIQLKENFVAVDKFHCNQIFQGYDNQIYALVHHAHGKQLLKKVAKKILKLQGDGGIINLTTGQSYNLKLSAPHNVRKISGDYWIFSSGDSKIKLFDQNWEHFKTLPTTGWARGADLNKNKLFCGISAPRKRYRKSMNDNSNKNNLIEVFDVINHIQIGNVTVQNVEQINNLYLLSHEQLNLLKAL